MSESRATAFALLALCNLLWAGNWVVGRALRDAFDPVSLNFWRWLIAVLVLAPFALPGLAAHREVLLRRAGYLLLLAFFGVALFHSLVYLGLRTTTAVNAVLINCSLPLFILICSWALERERATLRQLAGILVSVPGLLVILARGEPARLAELEFHAGDAWILLAMPVWGVYSVLLKRRPPELGGLHLLFVLAAAGVLLLAPLFAWETLRSPPRLPSAAESAAVLYVALAASIGAYICWNRGVAIVGANAAGFTLYLLPIFGTLLAIAFLGESFSSFHAVGIAIVVAGVILATRAPARGA